MDLLAYERKKDRLAHVEISVTHQLNWCYTIDELRNDFDKKFFGVPPKRSSSGTRKTDFDRGTSYRSQIEATYTELGFELSQVDRVYVCWTAKGENNVAPIEVCHRPNDSGGEFMINVLSFRDYVLPELTKHVSTANYDDEVLRTLSLIKECERQTKAQILAKLNK